MKILVYFLKRLTWQQLVTIIISSLECKPEGCRDIIIRRIVAKFYEGRHLHKNPAKRAA